MNNVLSVCVCARLFERHYKLVFFFFQHCLGKSSCTIPLKREAYDQKEQDTCPETFKVLAAQALCVATP